LEQVPPIEMRPKGKSELAAILVLITLTASAIMSPRLKATPGQEETNKMRRFSSYQQLKQFLASHQQVSYWPYITFDAMNSLKGGVSLAGLSKSTTSVPADVPYSTTNVQVEGVDEADVVKTDGKFLYVISGEKVLLIEAYPPESMALLSSIDLEGRPMGIFVSGDRLVIFEQIYSAGSIDGDGENMPGMTSGMGNVSVKVYDISDRGDPRLLRNYLVNGLYSDSRMIEPYIYLVVGEPALIYNEDVILPRIYGCDGVKEVGASDIYYCESSGGYYSFSTVFALNVQDVNAEPSYQTFLTTSSDTLFMSRDNIYIAQTFWKGAEDIVWNGLIVPPSQEVTAVHKIHVKGLKIDYVAKGEVPGHVLNQFSMDEFDGFFRIATMSIKELSDGSGRTAEVSNMYVLDQDMKVVGALEGIAPGERMHSARFVGDKCYMVTFKKVDPLFVIDLSSPTDPRILGRLKIPGYSDYLQPFGEGFLIGVGKGTMEAEEGDFAWYQGLKISLFDVRELDHPKEVSKVVIGDRGTDSPALRDHKAFLLDMGRGLLIIPVLVAKIDPSDYPDGVPAYAYGEYVWQGAYILRVSTGEGIKVLGRITHLDDGEILRSGYYFDSKHSVQRAVYINNALYTLSEGKIKANDISTLQELKSLELGA
jgi:inhibitor of cysteine peptidase